MEIVPVEALEVAIAIFAKAPIPGFAKTRLIPALGPEGAAELQSRLSVRAICTASSARIGPVSLWCAPNQMHLSFQALQERYHVSLHDQGEGDLGSRMLRAFAMVTPDRPLIIIGVDCPALSPRHLSDCAALLREGMPVIFLSAEDGGYVLIGSRSAIPSLFHDMPWGSDRVMALSRLRLRQANINYAEPATLWDVDEPEDYDRAGALGLI